MVDPLEPCSFAGERLFAVPSATTLVSRPPGSGCRGPPIVEESLSDFYERVEVVAVVVDELLAQRRALRLVSLRLVLPVMVSASAPSRIALTFGTA